MANLPVAAHQNQVIWGSVPNWQCLGMAMRLNRKASRDSRRRTVNTPGIHMLRPFGWMCSRALLLK
ncbi:MAG: hypothetical protein VX533_01435 [Pseudomonadota bacterium]|nr:hypothetical protein [Pseudomonadota bacterium]